MKLPKIKWQIIVAIIISLGIIGYAYINVTYNKKALEMEMKKEAIDESVRQKQLENCIRRVEKAYYDNWNRSCEGLGRIDECLLPNQTAESIEKTRQTGIDYCLERHK